MELVFSIGASSLIFILFRLFPRYGIHTLQAVIANYFVAFSCGIVLFSSHFPSNAQTTAALPYALLCGVLFISLFVMMGISSQKNGVASTSIAVKMSMALSVLLVLVVSATPIAFGTIAPLFLALTGVFLVSFEKNSTKTRSYLWMLFVLFIGSAGLDLVLYLARAQWLPKNFHEGIFASLGFLTAGLIGLLYFVFTLLAKKNKFHLRSWWAGILLGIPNYFSIYLLVKSYGSMHLSPAQILSLANVGVVVLTSLFGYFLFKEGFTTKKTLGLLLCLLALTLFVWPIPF